MNAPTPASTFTELVAEVVAERPDDVFLRTVDSDETWTWRRFMDDARRIAAGYRALGVEAGDGIGLLMTNRPEFYGADFGAVLLRAVPMSIYATSSPEQIAHVARDSQLKLLVCEAPFLPAATAARDLLDDPFTIVVIGADPPAGATTLDALLAHEPIDLDAAVAAADPDDLLTVIYTSGTTGPPKGVELTHRALLAAAHAIGAVAQPLFGGRVICWLPMAHIAERDASYYLAVLYRCQVTTCPDPRRIGEALQQVRPNWFFAVPRVWEKLKAGAERALSALPEAARNDPKTHAGVRVALGLDQARTTNVGAAPCAPEVIEFFHGIGVPLAEIWGMSEGCAAATLNPTDAVRIGSTGPALPGIELKVADDGEILLRGDVLMRGYRNLPEATAEAFTEDGFYRTGDVGRIDDDGYVWIVDRKKELMISSSGKNMSPANIEATIKSTSPLIGQVVVVGDARPYNVALIVVDPEAAAALGVEGDTAVNATVGAEIARAIEAGNARLSRVEQIKRYRILGDDWVPGGTELTPTMKLKRKPIEQRYAGEIDALYGPLSQ